MIEILFLGPAAAAVVLVVILELAMYFFGCKR